VSASADGLHPSAAVGRLIGQLALNTAVPEPGSLPLLALAVVLMAGMLRRGRKQG
jgi:hypothetical protein